MSWLTRLLVKMVGSEARVRASKGLETPMERKKRSLGWSTDSALARSKTGRFLTMLEICEVVKPWSRRRLRTVLGRSGESSKSLRAATMA